MSSSEDGITEDELKMLDEFNKDKDGTNEPTSKITDGKMKMIVQKPPDELLHNNKRGDTDMELCGWCKYCGSGMETVQYECFIQGVCSLIPLEIKEEYDWLNVRKFFEYDDDSVKNMTKSDFKELLKRYNRQASQDMVSRKSFKRNYRLLQKLYKKGEVDSAEPVGSYDVVLWGTPCIIKMCLGNADFRKTVFDRYDAMFAMLDEKSRRRESELKRLKVLRGGKKFGIF